MQGSSEAPRALEQRLLERPMPDDWWVYSDWLTERDDPWAPVVLAGLRGQTDLSEFGLGTAGIRRLGAWARPLGARSSVNLRWNNGVRAQLAREAPSFGSLAAPTDFRLLEVGHVRDRLDELPPLPPATTSLTLFVSSAPTVRALCGLNLRKLELSASLGELDLDDLPSVGPLRELGLDAFTVSLAPLVDTSLVQLKLGPRVRTSLEPLPQLKDLSSLNLNYFQGKLEPLADMAQLRTLTITYGKLGRELTPLHGLPHVTTLSVKGLGVSLAPRLPALTRLLVEDVDLSLDQLAGCDGLRELRISRCRKLRTLDGLEALAGLEVLEIDGAGLVDVSAIRRGHALRRVQIRRCPEIVDLAPVRDLEGVDVDMG